MIEVYSHGLFIERWIYSPLTVCKQIQKYHTNTLTIIELSRNDDLTLEKIHRELPDIRFITFKENSLFTEDATHSSVLAWSWILIFRH